MNVGKIVKYKEDGFTYNALVAHVWNDTCINLVIVQREDCSELRTSVVFGDDERQWNYL